MLTPPRDLPDLEPVLARGWGLSVASMDYRPMGWGSHHWEVTDAAGTRWFVTVDELSSKLMYRGEPPDTAFARLHAAFAAARALADHGHGFVVAPEPAGDGEPVVRMGRFAVAVYPFVDGHSYEWGEAPTHEHARAVLDLVVTVHTAPDAVRRHAVVDDFALQYRDELTATLAGEVADAGPYSRPAARLVAEHATPIRRRLDRYDELVAAADPARAVLTHGEPHPGNTLRTADGWRLIDWDTTLVAPPERDVWQLADPDAYAEATGVAPVSAMLELYELRWALSDVAFEVTRFRAPHGGSPDDDKAWEMLREVVAGLR